MLQSPFFFHRDDWIEPPSWKKAIQVYKTYDTDAAEADKLWEMVRHRLPTLDFDPAIVVANPNRRSDRPQFVFPRLGQGNFRAIVTDAYSRKCALTESHILHVLDAAHIKPFSKDGPQVPPNGILLRQDVHTLFDRGYITVTPEYRAEVSKRIQDEFDNGKEYYALQGKKIVLPTERQFMPAKEFLEYHNEKIFMP